MGFHRQLQPAALERAEVTAVVARFVAEEITAEEITTLTAPDPFLIDDPCPGSPDGHYPLRFHREIVCPHCAKVLWS